MMGKTEPDWIAHDGSAVCPVPAGLMGERGDMFGFLTNMIDNALGVTGDILNGETPSRRRVAQLISDGISVTVIATMFGVGVEVIEALIEDTTE